MQQEGEQLLDNTTTAAKMQEGEQILGNTTTAATIVSTAAGGHPVPPPAAINTTKRQKSFHLISNRSHNVQISHGLTLKRKTPTSAAGRVKHPKPIPGYQPLCNIIHVQIGMTSEIIQDRIRLAHQAVRGATTYIAAAIEEAVEDEARIILLPWELEYSKKARSSLVARRPRSGSRAGLQRLKLAAQGALPLATENKSRVGVATGGDVGMNDDGDDVEKDVVRHRNNTKKNVKKKKKTNTAKKAPIGRGGRGGGGWSIGGGNFQQQQQQQYQKKSWNHHRHLASTNDIDFNIDIDFDDDDFDYFDDMYDDKNNSAGKKRKKSNRNKNNNNSGSASRRILLSNELIPLPLPSQLGHNYNNHAGSLKRGIAPPPPQFMTSPTSSSARPGTATGGGYNGLPPPITMMMPLIDGVPLSTTLPPPPPPNNALMVGGFEHQPAIVHPAATTTRQSPTQLGHQLQHQVALVTLPKEQQQVIIQSLVVEMTEQERTDLQKLLPAQQVQILQNYYENRFLAQQQQQKVPLLPAIPGPTATASAPINTNNNNNNSISISGSPLLRPSASVGGLFEFGRLGAPSPGLDKIPMLDNNNNGDDEEKKRVLEVADIFS